MSISRSTTNVDVVSMIGTIVFKDVRAKIFHSIEFFKFVLQADNELLVPEMKKKNGGHRLRFRDKACGRLY